MKESVRRSAPAHDEWGDVYEREGPQGRVRHERLRLMERRRRDALRADADQAYDSLGDDFGEELDDE